MWIFCRTSSYLIFQGSQVSLKTLVFAKQSLHTGQVSTKVIRGHQLLLLLDPTDGLIHIPIVRMNTHVFIHTVSNNHCLLE